MKKLISVLSITLLISMLLSSITFAINFKEIDLSEINEPSSWAKPEVAAAKEIELITDSVDNYFKEDITRHQFAELVTNMTEKAVGKQITPASQSTFDDTKDINILKAYSAGIIQGVGNNKFAPDNYITREQIATMLYRAINYIEKEKGKNYTVKDENVDRYMDRHNVSSWAQQGVGILANNGIMEGTSKTTLAPKGTATIEQSILLVYRLYNKVTK